MEFELLVSTLQIFRLTSNDAYSDYFNNVPYKGKQVLL